MIFRKCIKRIDKTALKNGVIMGFLVSASLLFQVLGCAETTVGKNAFLTSVYVAIIPFITWVRKKKRPETGCFIGAVTCTLGIALLSLSGESGINRGDVLSLVSGILWAFDFEYTGEYSKKSEAECLLVVQIAVSAVITTVLAVFMSPLPTQMPSVGVVGCIVYTGIIANCISYLFQFKGQKLTDTFTSSVIFALEAVFAGIFSFFIFKEAITPRFAVGAFLIFISVLAPKIKLRQHTKKSAMHNMHA